MTIAALPDHLPPQSIDAEQATLGAALISRTAVERVLEMLQRDDFYLEAHRRIFDVLGYLANRDEPADLQTLSEELRRREQLDSAGGIAYINTLIDTVPTAAHVEYYARTVAEKSILRKLIDVAAEIRAMAHDEEEEPDEILDRAEALVFAIAQRRLREGLMHVRPVVVDVLARLEQVSASTKRITGTTTGFADLDLMTSGFQPGDLIIVASRPSMGKTALSLSIAIQAAAAAENDRAVAIFSLEMSKSQLAQRMLCAEATVDAMRFRSGFLRVTSEDDENDWTRLGKASTRLGDLPIFIDDTSDSSVLEMRTKCRRLKRESGLELVVVDYLQLMRGHGRQENRTQEISLIARSLKSMARELNVPVIALSQLSRNVEHRENKRPMLSDLRESGSIEAEADLVMMLYRESYYSRSEAPTIELQPGEIETHPTEIIVAKHRNGPVGTVLVGFQRQYARFVELSDDKYQMLRDLRRKESTERGGAPP